MPSKTPPPAPPDSSYGTFEEYEDRTSPGQPSMGGTSVSATPAAPLSSNTLGPMQASGTITPYVTRSRIYAFIVDEHGNPIELGSGRFA